MGTVTRARKIQRFLSQPFTVAETFTGTPGRYVHLKDTIKGFTMILDGELDAIPEVAFYMVGDIERSEPRPLKSLPLKPLTNKSRFPPPKISTRSKINNKMLNS